MDSERTVEFIEAPQISINNIFTYSREIKGNSHDSSLLSDSVVHCYRNGHCTRGATEPVKITKTNFTIQLPARHQEARFDIDVYVFGYVRV